MKRLAGLILVALVTTLTALADKNPPKQHKHAMPCCYCACRIEDKVHECHKLCELPDGDGGRKRAFTKTENRLCTELCAIKKEGCVHLSH